MRFILMSLLFLSASVMAEESSKRSSPEWEELQKRWQQFPQLRSDFKQERHLKVLSKPLVSEGQFIYIKEKGICWRMRKPWPQEFVVTPNAVLQREEGEAATSVVGDANPMFTVFSKAFFALFSGDLFVMEKWFEMELELLPTHWEITLTPKDEAVEVIASEMLLKGQNYLHEVSLYDVNDDSTVISFIGTTGESKALTAKEQACYQ